MKHNIKDGNDDDDEKNILLLSKRQRKRLAKKLKWESRKHEKRLKERARKKQRIDEAKSCNIKLGPSRKELKHSKMILSKCKTSIVIDLSFDELMSNKDLNKVIKQTLRVYSLNRRSSTPVQLYLTSFNGLIENEIQKHDGYQNWDINFKTESYLSIFNSNKDKLIYLTSDSDHIINELYDDHIYIIGGLVDHNQHKGLCYKLACDNNIKHGQLPINQYIQMRTRKVLTIDQVFEILLRVIEGSSWKESFLKVIPERKGAIEVDAADTADEDADAGLDDVNVNVKT
ncbi:tRNA methyltransferase 10 homolog A [Chrysoperla carnea]|uniref:tRNA methyltransferase 10 homolog A n=1 Tax=Chrysoperla carnea TaxID=189513 RepID=UPI001D098E8E|nr:tRNA methyltransferase 10 homolog A [Chrysoperla carnea]